MKKRLGILYWHIIVSKFPRFGKACKRNLVKLKKQIKRHIQKPVTRTKQSFYKIRQRHSLFL